MLATAARRPLQLQTAMHLFLVVLGGRSRGCHIEQHDVRFVAGGRIEDTLPQLRRQWFGLQRGLHLDSWLQVRQVEGWRVELRPEPFTGPQRLWFINVGAYDPDCPWELHAFGLFVADTAAAAKAQAKRRLLVGAAQQHKDDSCAVETVAASGPTGGAAASTAVNQPPLPGMAGTGTETGPQPDDVLALQRLGRWHVHLLPQPGSDSAWRPLRPDWFGYRRLDRAGDG